ncbi:MAG: WD40 repeat domain-containing protein [Chloroflexi bacterium]|nr:WD40 repeat domain-containing protein [Chloroflexota bacterium]
MEQPERYLNLSALRAAHRQLLEHRRQDEKSPPFLDEIERFIQKGQATGALLDADEDRWDAQNLLDYWANELYHARRDPLDANLDEFNPDKAPHLADDLCPYIGLDAFDAARQDYYFGRDSLIAAAGADRNIWVWKTTSGNQKLALQQNDAALNAVRFHPNGAILAAAGEDGIVKLWRMDDGRLAQSFDHGAAVQALAFNPNGSWLASAGDDGRVQIWNSANGELIQTLAGHEGVVNSVVFNHDGSQLATAGGDGAAKLWDAAAGSLLHTFSGHAGAVTDIAFSPDGAHLATASSDRTTKLWNITAGQATRTLLGHTATIHSVVFSPDGRHLATASSDRTVQINSLTSLAELFIQGQNQATRQLTPEECEQYLRGRPCLMEQN